MAVVQHTQGTRPPEIEREFEVTEGEVWLMFAERDGKGGNTSEPITELQSAIR